MMKVVFVSSSLAPGGAERVISIMANYWTEQSWDVSIITLSDASSDFYALAPAIHRVGLGVVAESSGVLSAVPNNLKRVSAIRSALLKIRPDVVISFCDTVNVLTLMACANLKIPVVISERTDPNAHPIGRFWETLRRLMYPRACAVVCQSTAVSNWAHRLVSSRKIKVIPNPVLPPSVLPHAARPLQELVPALNPAYTVFMAMGRFTEEKGFDLLLKAMNAVLLERTECCLVIIGDGPLRQFLQSHVADMGLTERVFFVGYVKDPSSYLANADIFVLPSRYEGFPNALCEAMSCGLPVISFDCPSGPRAIIRDGIDGILVPNGDFESLAHAMVRLVVDPAERERIAARAPEVMERFGLEKVMGMWQETILLAQLEV